MDVERGLYGSLPYAAVGSGSPLVVLAGLMPVTGLAGDGLVKSVLHPLLPLAGSRRLVMFNRRARLPRGMTMAELAGEHADALRGAFAAPVDLVGTSTGGSIAAQLSADHGELVGRLALISAACRLGPAGSALQARVAESIQRGKYRRAAATAAAGLVPPRRGRIPAAAAGWLAAGMLAASPDDWADTATTIEAEDGFDLAACATPITAPTLILAGRDDRFYSPALFEQTARLIAGSHLQLITGRGHITVTRDRRFTPALATFFGWPATGDPSQHDLWVTRPGYASPLRSDRGNAHGSRHVRTWSTSGGRSPTAGATGERLPRVLAGLGPR